MGISDLQGGARRPAQRGVSTSGLTLAQLRASGTIVTELLPMRRSGFSK